MNVLLKARGNKIHVFLEQFNYGLAENTEQLTDILSELNFQPFRDEITVDDENVILNNMLVRDFVSISLNNLDSVKSVISR